MGGILFITAPSADAKAVNRILLHLRDWEYGDEDAGDSFKLVATTSIPSDWEATAPPVSDFCDNEWAGKKVEDVEAFALRLAEAEAEAEALVSKCNSHNAIIVDEQGLVDQTCIILDRVYEHEPFKVLDRFRRTRLPWSETHIMWANLNIANMDFDEYCNQDKGDIGDGWWEYAGIPGIKEPDAVTRKRTAALKALKDLDQV